MYAPRMQANPRMEIVRRPSQAKSSQSVCDLLCIRSQGYCRNGMRRNGPSVAESLFTLEETPGGASQRGVLSGHGLLAGDEETQPRAATVGADLQHGAATSVARLLNPEQFLLRGSF